MFRSVLNIIGMTLHILASILIVLALFVVPCIMLNVFNNFTTTFGQVLLIGVLCGFIVWCVTWLLIKIGNTLINL